MNEPAAVVGSMHEAGGSGVVRMETRFDTTVEDVWEALTTPARLARWLGNVDGDLRLAGTFHATFTSQWTGHGVVEVCEPPRRLLVRMRPDEEEAVLEETVIEAVVTPDGAGTRLVVEERGLSLGALHAYGAGWQVHVEDLGHHLRGTARTAWHDRWVELAPAYRELSGP